MPGGRGRLLEVAKTLNGKDDDRATRISIAVKNAIEQKEYRIGATVTEIGESFAGCDQPAHLMTIWCLALERGAVDWEY